MPRKENPIPPTDEEQYAEVEYFLNSLYNLCKACNTEEKPREVDAGKGMTPDEILKADSVFAALAKVGSLTCPKELMEFEAHLPMFIEEGHRVKRKKSIVNSKGILAALTEDGKPRPVASPPKKKPRR